MISKLYNNGILIIIMFSSTTTLFVVIKRSVWMMIETVGFDVCSLAVRYCLSSD